MGLGFTAAYCDMRRRLSGDPFVPIGRVHSFGGAVPVLYRTNYSRVPEYGFVEFVWAWFRERVAAGLCGDARTERHYRSRTACLCKWFSAIDLSAQRVSRRQEARAQSGYAPRYF